MTTDTIEDAANKADISRGTAYNYLKDEEFNKEYQEQRQALMKHTTARLQRLTNIAVDKLEEYMLDPNTSAHSMNALINTALSYAYKALELETIENRITEIERMVEGGE